MTERRENPTIVVIGLGYVGLPLAVALARRFRVTGYDIDRGRIAELQSGNDRTGEVDCTDLRAAGLALTGEEGVCSRADVYIVTVPTPVDSANQPDLEPLLSATRMLGRVIDPARRPTIVYESTVYPGVTEDICGGLLAELGLERGRDFRLGYSPERINPGDRNHRIDTIVKVIAGEDAEVVEQLAELYGAVTSAGVFRASSIKVAETAKAIENAQRDINVAFLNEVARIAEPLDISMWDVLDAARTKWNFLPFEPGLVGGHCIGVDPYYLSHLAQRQGHDPQVILAGRRTNDTMGGWIADRLHERRKRKVGSALILGLTFKENVPDLRNSGVAGLVERLSELGHRVSLADPLADPQEVMRYFGKRPEPVNDARYDVVVGAVKHDVFRSMSSDQLAGMLEPNGTLADIKAMWRHLPLPPATDYWTL